MGMLTTKTNKTKHIFNNETISVRCRVGRIDTGNGGITCDWWIVGVF